MNGSLPMATMRKFINLCKFHKTILTKIIKLKPTIPKE
jgi:hypothetical protein